MFRKVGKKYMETALIKLIAVGLVIGIVIALAAPGMVPLVAIFGDLFVRALKGVAPVLVFVLVMNAMAQKNADASASMRPIVKLYVFATFLASLVAVAYSFAFPTSLQLQMADAKLAGSVGEARRFIDGGGVKINGEAVAAKAYNVSPDTLVAGTVIQHGKRKFVRLV